MGSGILSCSRVLAMRSMSFDDLCVVVDEKFRKRADLCTLYMGCAYMYAWRMVGDQGGVGVSEFFLRVHAMRSSSMCAQGCEQWEWVAAVSRMIAGIMM